MRGSDCNNNNNHNNLIYLTFVVLLVILLFSCSPNQTFASIQSDLDKIDAKGLVILEGASLIDGTGSPPRNDSVVVLKDEQRIQKTQRS
jgi:hypothetical protein